MAEDRFRQDLYYRLDVIELPMPSLRDRADDIPELADQILTRLAAEYGESKPAIGEPALRSLMSYEFPGNVRELENILERAFTLCENDCIEQADLQLSDVEPVSPSENAAAPQAPSSQPVSAELSSGESLEDHLEAIERKLITDALESTRWNKTAAAKRLGITFRALRYRLKKLGLD